MLKFLSFQEMYFQDGFDPDYEVAPKPELKNVPVLVRPSNLRKYPTPGRPLVGDEMKEYVEKMTEEIAGILGLDHCG
jgi:threonine synthase